MTTTSAPETARSTHRTLASNSLANALRVASTSLVALVLPLALALAMTHSAYGAWAVLFGLAALAQYFDFGVPVAVQTLVARDQAAGPRAAHVLRAGLAWSTVTGLILLAVAAVVGVASPAVFPSMPLGVAVVATTLALLVAGNAATLVGNTAAAYFLGVHKALRPAVLLVPARIASLLLATLAATSALPVAVIALAYALPLIAGTCVVARAGLTAADRSRLGRPSGRRLLDPALIRFSGSLVVWSVGMVAINGVGVLAVGRFDFAWAPLFAILTALASAVSGVQSALIAPVLSELGRRYSSQDYAGVATLVQTATRLNAAVLTCCVAGAVVLVPLLDLVLFDGRYGESPSRLLLVAAAVIGAVAMRLTMTPMTYGFIASATHGRIILPPLIEAAGTVGFVWAGAMSLGIVGAALGLLAGAVLGVLLALLWSHRLSGAVPVGAARIARLALALPGFALVPVLLVAAVAREFLSGPPEIAIEVVGGLCTVVLVVGLVVPRPVLHRAATRLRRRAIRSGLQAGDEGSRA